MHDTAYFASLLFTVHPIHTESVAGLVGRADILSSVLFIIVLLVYQKVRNAKGEAVILWFVIMIFLISCSVLCKETAISVLVSMLFQINEGINIVNNQWKEFLYLISIVGVISH